MANKRIMTDYRCIGGHVHPIAPGNLRGMLAAAKRGDFGPEAKTDVAAGKPFILCPWRKVE